MTLLELKSSSLTEIQTELEQKVAQSPEFFKQSPIVFGFEQLSDSEQDQIDLSELIRLCRDLNLMPAATRGGNTQTRNKSLEVRLAHLPKGRVKAVETTLETAGDQPPIAEKKDKPTPIKSEAPAPVAKAQTKIISTPVRSGQQIYAQGGDLIVLSSVSAGAEVLADGNIHIYGALRGRALAGVGGDESARIFCSSQEAELIAIAGHYLVDETLRHNRWRESVQVFLENDILTIKGLV